jgi:hypothetical protein
VSLFSKPVQLHAALEPHLRGADQRVVKQVARDQDLILGIIGGEPANLQAFARAADGRIAVVTGDCLNVIQFGRVSQKIPLEKVADAEVRGGNDGFYHGTASPGIDLAFASFDAANDFLLAIRRRDIPKLYPSYLDSILERLGAPGTETNRARLMLWAARMFTAGGAFSYLAQDPESKAEYERRFMGGAPVSPSLLDDIVDWLWAWSVNCHKALRELPGMTESTLLSPESPVRDISPSGEIPLPEW